MFNLPDGIEENLKRFREMTARFREGGISAAEYRAFRVPHGVYEQREEGTFMLRVRLAAGGLLPHQMRCLAKAAKKYGNGVLHVTTRQDIQVHRVALDNLHAVLDELYSAGLTTKGGGGNTVRNVTCCYDAGVCAWEEFDVAPFSIALTEFLLSDPGSYRLPRKYKIAFSGCSKDCSGATVNDLGFIAKKRGDEIGFSVYVGGGMGAHSRTADLLSPFVPAHDVHLVAEAVKQVFDRHGNRKDKHKARLRFLIEKIGLDRFRELYQAVFENLRKSGFSPLVVRELPERDASDSAPEGPAPEGFQLWRERNTVSQKQAPFHMAHIPLFLGDISAETLANLAGIVEEHGERMIRTTQWQNMVLRWVHQRELVSLYESLDALGLGSSVAPIVRNTIACAGASTCRLGVCRSRGVARAVTREISRNGIGLNAVGELNLHISGCPNACGRHPIGGIGLFGAARRVQQRLVPHYIVQLGGKVHEGETRFAEGEVAFPARNVPVVVAEILKAFNESAQFPDYDAFLESEADDLMARLARKYRDVPPFEEDKNFYYDWDSEVPFSLEGRGPGECSAGVFDLIEVDLATSRECLNEGRLYRATVLASRALLITQGHDTRDDAEALDLFNRLFVGPGLVSDSFGPLIERAQACASTAEPESSFEGKAEEVSRLIESVQTLYANMDDSLRFPKAMPEGADKSAESEPTVPDRKADFRGVVCPLNYMKTRLVLNEMRTGEILSVLLDEEGFRNVPESVNRDGHRVVSIQKKENRWEVLIRKR